MNKAIVVAVTVSAIGLGILAGIGGGMLVGRGGEAAVPAPHGGPPAGVASFAPGGEFAIWTLMETVGPDGFFDCYADGYVSARNGQVRAAQPGTPDNLVGTALHALDRGSISADERLPDLVRADPSGRMSEDWTGPVHFAADGKLVEGWALCREITE